MNERIVVFSPHPDDETLGCGGTIAKNVSNGREVYIAIMTDGRNSHRTELAIEKDPTPEEMRSVRRKEALQAAKILGVPERNVSFFDLEDGSLERNYDSAQKLVKDYLSKLLPNTIFVPHELDTHKDHHATNAIVMMALKELGLHPHVYCYVIWSSKKSQRLLKLSEIEVDISNFLDLKRRAIETYKSQVSLLFPSQTRPVLSESFVDNFSGSKEHFVRKGRDRSEFEPDVSL